MRKFTLLVFIIFGQALTAQNDDIKHTIETFFEGFHHRDTVLLHQVCADKMILQSITENSNGNSLTEEPSQFFYRSIASIPMSLKFNERILSFTTQVDGSMGNSWTHYEIYVDGKLSHKGVNAFTLFKEKDQWKIVYIIDTRRK
jgi:hypothetical protein